VLATTETIRPAQDAVRADAVAISTVSIPLYPSFGMLRLTEMPPHVAASGSFSTMKQVMPSSVRAASATSPARWPLVTQVLVPVITYSSPSRTARHVIALVSLPASGSESERHPRISPVASRGSHRVRCSSVPWSLRRLAAITCVLRTPDNDIHPAASSSITPQ
jgi:hypothetical protein